MNIGLDEARRIAALAHFELTPAELERMAHDLSAILDYIDQLKEVDVSGVDLALETSATPLRDDVVALSLDPAIVEANAPVFAHGHFRVPKIIGGEP